MTNAARSHDATQRDGAVAGGGGGRGSDETLGKSVQRRKALGDFVHKAPTGNKDDEMIGQVDEAESRVNRRHDQEGRVTRNVKSQIHAITSLNDENDDEKQTPPRPMSMQQPTPTLRRQKTVEIDVDQRLHKMPTAEADQGVDVDRRRREMEGRGRGRFGEKRRENEEDGEEEEET